jgi:organic hydroperoxide reductase OsmC/OhrA
MSKPKKPVRCVYRKGESMKKFEATVQWQRGANEPFSDNQYSRAHEWAFDGGLRVPASSSPLSVPLPMSVAANVDPEEALVAAVSSCHMLFFLSIAAQRGFVVDSYLDKASGIMGRNPEGRIAMTSITLRPDIAFAGSAPDAGQRDAIHHSAHAQCYIANSIKADIVIEGCT